MKSNWQLRIVAILLAFFIWYLVSGQEQVETWIELPVEMVNLPENLVIRQGMVNRIEVRVRGPKGIVRGINTKGMAYTMDLGDLEEGAHTLLFDPKNISVSQPLKVMEINPPRVELDVDALIKKEVPVQINWQADLQEYFELKSTEIKPDKVLLQGPETLLDSIDKVQSQLIEIKKPVPREWKNKVSLDVSSEINVEPAHVQVKLNFGPETKVMWVKRPIEIKSSKNLESIKIDPEEVRLKLKLPIPLLGQEEWREKIQVELPIPERLKGRGHQLRFQVDLPLDTELIESNPEVIEVRLPSKTNSTTENNSKIEQ